MDNYTTTTLAGLVTTPASVTEYSLDASAPFPTVFKIDATYDPTSENAQSGVAVAEALKTVVIPVDLTFSATSENAQSGVAVQKAFSANNLSATSSNTILGSQASANMHYYCTCVGHNASSLADFGTAVGYGAVGHDCSVAVGTFSQCLNAAGFSIGYTGSNKDLGVGLFSVADGRNVNVNTRLYLIGANTPLANKYEEGAACLGYIVKSNDGTILERGTRKLSELLTNNTNFAPTSLDPDVPEPTPFMPTGITDPIELPEELTPTDQPIE